jgi:hypothetical protein
MNRLEKDRRRYGAPEAVKFRVRRTCLANVARLFGCHYVRRWGTRTETNQKDETILKR